MADTRVLRRPTVDIPLKRLELLRIIFVCFSPFSPHSFRFSSASSLYFNTIGCHHPRLRRQLPLQQREFLQRGVFRVIKEVNLLDGEGHLLDLVEVPQDGGNGVLPQLDCGDAAMLPYQVS